MRSEPQATADVCQQLEHSSSAALGDRAAMAAVAPPKLPEVDAHRASALVAELYLRELAGRLLLRRQALASAGIEGQDLASAVREAAAEAESGAVESVSLAVWLLGGGEGESGRENWRPSQELLLPERIASKPVLGMLRKAHLAVTETLLGDPAVPPCLAVRLPCGCGDGLAPAVLRMPGGCGGCAARCSTVRCFHASAQG